LIESAKLSKSGTASILRARSMLYVAGTGAKPNLDEQSLHSTFKTDQPSKYPTPRFQTPT